MKRCRHAAFAGLALLVTVAVAHPARAQEAALDTPLDTPLAIRAIIGLADPAQLLPAEAGARGVDLSRLDIPNPAGLVARLAALIGEPIESAALDRLRDAVTTHFREAGRPFVDIGLPEQDVTDGVLQLVIVEFRLGQVGVEGNAWFGTNHILSRAGLRPGQVVDKPELDRRIAQLNAGPYLVVTPEFRPGTAPGTTDAVLRVQDRLPLQVTASLTNTGSPSTGLERLALGAAWGDAFGRGDTLSWTFTTSPDFWHERGAMGGRERPPAFVGHSLGWQTQLPWGHSLSLSGGHMRQSPKLGPDLGSRGLTVLAGAVYAVPLSAPDAAGAQELSFGYDFKRTNNDLSFGGATVQRGFTEVSQFTLRHMLAVPHAGGQTQLQSSLVLSPGGMTSENTDTAFQPNGFDQSGTPGAKARYAYGRVALTRMAPLTDSLGLVLRASGQWASGTLLPSEQMSLAGSDAVRGYHEFGVAASDGVLLTAELRGPRIPLPRLMTRLIPGEVVSGAAADAVVQPHLFADWGRGWNRVPSVAAPARVSAASIGIGTRIEMGRGVSLRLEQGWQLIEAPRQGADGAFLHLALTGTW